MDFVTVTRPTEAEILNIVSVADMKLNMRVTNSAEDDVFKACILAAYDWLAGPEVGWLNRTLIDTEYLGVLPGWVGQKTTSVNGVPTKEWVPTSVIELPLPPLKSVESVKYMLDGVQTTLGTDQYGVSLKSLLGRVYRLDGITWPTGMDIGPETVEIAFTCGYGDGAAVKAKCPGIVQAIKLLAGDAFRNREDTYAEPRLVAVNRQIINGVRRFAGRYKIENSHA